MPSTAKPVVETDAVAQRMWSDCPHVIGKGEIAAVEQRESARKKCEREGRARAGAIVDQFRNWQHGARRRRDDDVRGVARQGNELDDIPLEFLVDVYAVGLGAPRSDVVERSDGANRRGSAR